MFQPEVVSIEHEDFLWDKGLLGDHNSSVQTLESKQPEDPEKEITRWLHSLTTLPAMMPDDLEVLLQLPASLLLKCFSAQREGVSQIVRNKCPKGSYWKSVEHGRKF